jgi:hypothetical protein
VGEVVRILAVQQVTETLLMVGGQAVNRKVLGKMGWQIRAVGEVELGSTSVVLLSQVGMVAADWLCFAIQLRFKSPLVSERR